MKFSIAWHETTLQEWADSVDRMIANRDRINDEIARNLTQLAEYNEQIAEARRRGITTFDRDKFNKKRKNREIPKG